MADKESSGQSNGGNNNVDATYMDNQGNSHTIFNSDGGGKHGDHGHATVDSQGNVTYARDSGERKK